jgi:hypothetical protein
MSSHTPSHGHGSHSPKWFFTTPDSWLASKKPAHINLFEATEEVAHNSVDATIGTARRYVADILNQLRYAGKNLMAVREHGWKSLPRALAWAVTNTGKAVTNIITGIPHALDRVVTKWVNDSVVDLSSGSVDHVPLVGKATGNLMKLWGGIVTAPTRFLSWITKKVPDRFIDWINDGVSLVKPTRHLGNSDTWGHWHGKVHH